MRRDSSPDKRKLVITEIGLIKLITHPCSLVRKKVWATVVRLELLALDGFHTQLYAVELSISEMPYPARGRMADKRTLTANGQRSSVHFLLAEHLYHNMSRETVSWVSQNTLSC